MNGPTYFYLNICMVGFLYNYFKQCVCTPHWWCCLWAHGWVSNNNKCSLWYTMWCAYLLHTAPSYECHKKCSMYATANSWTHHLEDLGTKKINCALSYTWPDEWTGLIFWAMTFTCGVSWCVGFYNHKAICDGDLHTHEWKEKSVNQATGNIV